MPSASPVSSTEMRVAACFLHDLVESGECGASVKNVSISRCISRDWSSRRASHAAYLLVKHRVSDFRRSTGRLPCGDCMEYLHVAHDSKDLSFFLLFGLANIHASKV